MGIKNENKHLKLNIQLFASDAEVKFKVVLDENEAEKSISNLSSKTEKMTSKLSSVGKAMTIGITTPLTALATAGIKYNATMETYSANLTTLLGGNKKQAEQLLSDLKEMANTTPFETTSLVKATQTMLGFGIKVQDSQKYLKQLGDISMGDANKLDALTLAFSQVSSAGKLSGQDLLQMINAGFNPLNIISQKTGESMASLKERMGEGALSAGEVAQALEWATEKGGLFYGAMDKASQTTEGKISTLKDEFNTAVGELTTGLLPTFTKIVDKLTEMSRWFANLSDSGKSAVLVLAGIGISVGPTLVFFAKFLKAISDIKKVMSGLKIISKTATFIKAFGTAVGGTLKALGTFILNVTKSALALGKLAIQSGLATIKLIAQKVATVAMTIAQGALNLIMSLNPITLIVLAIVALIGVLVLLWNKCEWFRNGVMAVINAIWSTIKNVVNIIKNIVMAVLTAVWTYIKTYVNIYITIFKTIFTVIKTILTKVKSIFSTIFKVIATIVKTYINVVLSVFRTIWSVASNIVAKVKNAFVRLGSGIKSVFSSIKNFISNLFGKIAGVVKAPINAVIRGLNKIKLPSWVPGLGGKGINIPLLATGTNYVAGEGLAYLHKGEAVVPKKYNPAVGGFGGSQPVYVNVIADMDVNKFGKAFVRDIKTFSGGAKNDYNYGGM